MFKRCSCCLIAALVFLTIVPSAGNASLVAHWKFDEPSGAIAYDSVGAINGSLTGTSIFDPMGGILGGAVRGLAHGDFVDMGNNFMFGTVNFSVQAWIKTTYTGAIVPVYKHQGGLFNGYFLAVNDVGLGSIADNRAYFYVSNGITGVSSTIVNDGSWHQLVGVYDVTNNQTRLYVDGGLEATGPRNDMTTNSYIFLVGLSGLDTYLDEVRVWDHALTLSEVNELYEQTINPVPVPATVLLLASGLIGLAGTRRKLKK